ncbi:hypothetical protein A5685_11635 [Mycobacterium colombiense]|uniref:Uncharacterized protein n=1 Tax=Mycobacterium colombiense TaxID=339268 RepID=A0A1A2RSE3_9MYCO|nr:hypothetical protein A5685_11635 [Mycobacterium colombiense]
MQGNPVIVQVLNGLLGAVLGIPGAVIWLIGLLLCVTVLLIPLGKPVMKLGGRFSTLAGGCDAFPLM